MVNKNKKQPKNDLNASFRKNSTKLCARGIKVVCCDHTHTAVSWREATCAAQYFSILSFFSPKGGTKSKKETQLQSPPPQKSPSYTRTTATFRCHRAVRAALCLLCLLNSPLTAPRPQRPSPRQLHARPLSCRRRRPRTSSPGRSRWPPFLLPVVPRLKITLPVVEVPRGSRLLLGGRTRNSSRFPDRHTRGPAERSGEAPAALSAGL